MIYDYLFYKGYQTGKWSKNFEDMLALAGIMWVAMCFMFNIFTIAFMLDGMGIANSINLDSTYKYTFALLLVLLLILYYTYGGRYKKIVERYEEKERDSKGWHPIIVIATYYILSFAFLLLSGMYRLHYGIFN